MGSKMKAKDVAKAEEKKKEDAKKETFKHKSEARKEIIRLANTDLDASRPLRIALTGIKGISYTMSKAVCTMGNFDPVVKLGTLNEQEIVRLEEFIYNLSNSGMPAWMVNRRWDPENGNNVHLLGADLDVTRRFDIQKMIDSKTWKGVRHMYGMPVRGQRTRSSFKKGKTVGVVRKAVRMTMKGGAETEKKEEKK